MEIPFHELQPGQRAVVSIYDLATRSSRVVFETSDLALEAPNWTADGLILNARGLLYRLAVEPGAVPQPLDLPTLPPVNNDHVPGAEPGILFASCYDFEMHRVDLGTGSTAPVVVTNDPPDVNAMHFLHGVSPDGAELAYVGIQLPLGADLSLETFARIASHIYTVPAEGGAATQLTFGDRSSDGSEYSPDGEWLYFGTELFTTASGHSQIARMRPDGTELERLSYSDRVDWFPHASPDGTTFVYLSFPPGTEGHPENLDVELRLVTEGRWDAPETIVSLHGGQGTINVNSWSPDSASFAYVAY